MERSQIGWFAVATLIIAGMIYFTDVSRFMEHLRTANKIYLLTAVGIGLLAIPVWTNSWYQLLNHMGEDLSFYESLKLFSSGLFMNSVTPLGQFGGEPFMAYIIDDNTRLNYEESLSSVISADIINSIPIFTFVLGGSVVLLFFNSLNQFFLEILYIAVAVIAIGSGLAYLLWFKSGYIENKILSLAEKLSSKMGRGQGFVEGLEERLNTLQDAFQTVGENPKDLLKMTAIAHLFFVFQVFSLYLVMRSVGVETAITPLYFVLPMTSLANFSPTPGGSGAYEAAMATILTTLLGVQGSLAVTIGILYRFTTFWPGLIIGYLSISTLPNMEKEDIEEAIESEYPEN